jgi:hypothetical protein
MYAHAPALPAADSRQPPTANRQPPQVYAEQLPAAGERFVWLDYFW